MELLKFLNTHYDNWRDILTSSPYNLTIKSDGEYTIFKYNQIASDFSLLLVREARGVILTQSALDGSWSVVCRGFDKFSYGQEAWEQPIDWSTAIVREKVDGSLMKAWHYNGKWHLSTNGTINAFAAEVGDNGLTFGELFERAINDKFEHWAETHLFCGYTYMFELTSPLNKIVVDYSDTKIWLLGARDMFTMQEDDSIAVPGVDRPRFYDLTSMKDVLTVVAGMDGKEGVVVYDGNYNRIKVKSPDYLMKHQLANNGMITTRRVINMIKDLSIDDYLAFVGDTTGQVGKVQEAMQKIITRYEQAWEDVEQYKTLDRRRFAANVLHYKESGYLFFKYDGHEETAAEYVLNLSTRTLKTMIEKELEKM